MSSLFADNEEYIEQFTTQTKHLAVFNDIKTTRGTKMCIYCRVFSIDLPFLLFSKGGCQIWACPLLYS